VFTIFAEAIFVINFEFAPALFSFGKYLSQFPLLEFQFFKSVLTKKLSTYNFSSCTSGIGNSMVDPGAGNTWVLNSNPFELFVLWLKVRFMHL